MHASPCAHTTLLKFNISINIIAMDEAIAFLKSQDTPNYLAAAKKFNVNATTLSRRFNGKTVSRAEATSLHKKLLTDVQEQVLLDRIEQLSSRGMPPTPQILENMVVEIIHAPVGEKWVRRFCQRYKEQIKSVYLRSIDQTRQVADNSDHFQHFYELVSFYLAYSLINSVI
jgi:hypothetical protein